MLLILDINGLLCRKVQKDHPEANLVRPGYGVILRPGYKEFLEQCYAQYDVAFFSSTTKRNAEVILKAFLSTEQFKQTKFIWYRDRTSLDPDWHADQIESDNSWNDTTWQKEEIKTHSTIKLLQNVWNNPMINAQRKYNTSNTLICDDSAMKLRYNPQKNCLIVPAFAEETLKDDTLEQIWQNIVEHMQLL